MIPLEFRNRRDLQGWRAQEHYEPFRPTLFSSTTYGTHLGPGAFFKDKPFVTPAPAPATQQQQQQPLYRMERDVNPTRETSVQRFYDANRATDVGGALLERAGNAVASMKSAAPRFQPQSAKSTAAMEVRRGPGAYSPEKFHGAFTTTLERVTPAAARSDKLCAKRAFDASFAIVPSAFSAQPEADGRFVRGSVVSRMLGPSGSQRKWSKNRVLPAPRAECDGVELESASRQLVVALTPRNAYSNPVNREFVLAMRQQQQHQQQQQQQELGGTGGDLIPSHTSP